MRTKIILDNVINFPQTDYSNRFYYINSYRLGVTVRPGKMAYIGLTEGKRPKVRQGIYRPRDFVQALYKLVALYNRAGYTCIDCTGLLPVPRYVLHTWEQDRATLQL